jgi:hypothetical protein
VFAGNPQPERHRELTQNEQEPAQYYFDTSELNDGIDIEDGEELQFDDKLRSYPRTVN